MIFHLILATINIAIQILIVRWIVVRDDISRLFACVMRGVSTRRASSFGEKRVD
jgi:hypothetical protein